MKNHINALLKTAKKHRNVIYVFLIFSACVGSFALLADEVTEDDTLVYDTAALRAVRTFASPALDTIFVNGTNIGGVYGVAILTLLLAGYLLYKKHWRQTIFLAFAILGAALLNILLKLIFLRDRPELWERLVQEDSYSFPSGHAMGSSALAFTVITLFWRSTYRNIIVASAILFMLFIGLSRLYLGVHYPTDIIGGWLVSGAWVSLAYYTMRRPVAQRNA